MTNSEEQYFILTTADPMSGELSGAKSPSTTPATAYNLAQIRLNAKHWPLYKNTKNRNRIRARDRVAIYVGGRKEFGKHIIATAIVDNIIRGDAVRRRRSLLSYSEKFTAGSAKNADTFLEFDKPFVTGIPQDILIFDDITLLEKPVNLKKIIGSLSIRPTNESLWGTRLQGGCISVRPSDFQILFGDH